jgi:hypothetical protein
LIVPPLFIPPFWLKVPASMSDQRLLTSRVGE